MLAKIAITGLLLSLMACSAARPPAEPASQVPKLSPEQAAELGSSNPTEAVALEIVMTDQSTTGRLMQLRGQIVNPHSETVTGVRLQLAFLAPQQDDGAKVLEIQQKEMDVTLGPGESEMLRWDVESLYLSSDGMFALAAYPKRLGKRTMPPPDHWKE
jgi:hypothetical protein